jgi:hypothetical protein
MIKSKDITVLVILVSLSGLLSFFVSNALFSNKKSLSTKVELVDKVTSDFSYENKPYFTNNPLNPTKNITISQNDNQKPLGQ